MQAPVKAFILGAFWIILLGSLVWFVPLNSDSIGKWWFGLDANKGLLRFSYFSMLLGTAALLYLTGFTVISAQGDLELELVIRLSSVLFQESLWAPLVHYGFERKHFAWGAFFLLISVSINSFLLLIEVLDKASGEPLLVFSTATLFVHFTLTDAFLWNYFLVKTIREIPTTVYGSGSGSAKSASF
jgi:hypothetical protein